MTYGRKKRNLNFSQLNSNNNLPFPPVGDVYPPLLYTLSTRYSFQYKVKRHPKNMNISHI